MDQYNKKVVENFNYEESQLGLNAKMFSLLKLFEKSSEFSKLILSSASSIDEKKLILGRMLYYLTILINECGYTLEEIVNKNLEEIRNIVSYKNNNELPLDILFNSN